MGAQDKTEKVLRDMHVLFSKAQPYEGSTKNVIIDKNAMMDLLKELNTCMYEMMEEYELTVKSRDKASRKIQKQGDDIIFDAQRKAEDIYAASIKYTDNALESIQEIMKESEEAVEKIYLDAKKKIEQETRDVKHNQLELKGHLNSLIDTQKYLHLIEDENIRRIKEKTEGPQDEDAIDDAPKYAAPEIRVNPNYISKTDMPIDGLDEDDISDGEEQLISSEDLDAEYFKWQENESADEENESGKKGLTGLFSKKKHKE